MYTKIIRLYELNARGLNSIPYNSLGLSTFGVYVFEGVAELSNKVSVERNRGKPYATPYYYYVSLKNDERVNITRVMNIYNSILNWSARERDLLACSMPMHHDSHKKYAKGWIIKIESTAGMGHFDENIRRFARDLRARSMTFVSYGYFVISRPASRIAPFCGWFGRFTIKTQRAGYFVTHMVVLIFQIDSIIHTIVHTICRVSQWSWYTQRIDCEKVSRKCRIKVLHLKFRFQRERVC